MIRKNVLIIVAGIVLFSLNASSQIINNTYNRGYIVTGQDTIHCFVNDKDRYSGEIKYKTNSEKGNLTIISGVVSSLKNGSVIHDRIFTSEGSFLMTRIIKGEVSLYKNYFFYNKKPGSNQVETSIGGLWYCLVNQKHSIIFKKKGFKENLLLFFGDCSELNEEIEMMKYYEFQFKIHDFVERYNKWIEMKNL